MRSLLDMDTIQIEITNACVLQCSNCTRLIGHSPKPFFMNLDFFRAAVDSMKNFPKMIGIMGGEPLLHPQFEEISLYLHSKFPKERCGLWSTLPSSKKQYGPLIAEVYGNVLLNDHTHGELYHAPILVSGQDCIQDNFVMWYHIDHCWIQNCWSASITPKGAFFCEVAAAFDMVFNGEGGWPVALDWWKKTPKDYTEQMERLLKNFTDSLEGPIKGTIDRLESTIRTINDDIDNIEDRLLDRESYLTAQFSRANQALQQMNSLQGTLSMQLSQLSSLNRRL